MTPAARLSLGLASLAGTVFLLADLVGLVPDAVAERMEARKTVAEALAVQISSAASRGDVSLAQSTVDAAVQRGADIRSVGLRTADGRLASQAGGHEAGWVAPSGGRSTATHVQVPILQGDRRWGTLEVHFDPPGGAGLLNAFLRSGYAALVFVTLVAFGLFWLLIRRALEALDPAGVVPERVKAAFDTLTEGVLILDEKERIILANAAFAERSETPVRGLVGRRASSLTWTHGAGDAQHATLPWLAALSQGAQQTGVPLGLSTPARGATTFMANCAPILDSQGRRRGVLVTLDDVTVLEQKNAELASMLERLRLSEEEVRRQNRELELLATLDPLTGCLNRRAFFERFEPLFEQGLRRRQPLSCLMVDIDHFKSVNDRYGHAVGDKVIKIVADVLLCSTRSEDVVARYGGEEFCILLPGIEMEQAVAVAERIRLGIHEASEARFTSGLRVTASLGVSGIEAGAPDPAELVNQADQALYAAKHAGRNRVIHWGAPGTVDADPPPPSARQVRRQDEGRDVQELRRRVAELEATVEERERELREQYGRDAVTGLPNRFLFHDRVTQALLRARRYQTEVAVLSVGINTFQRVNDALGQVGGDRLLRELASRLSGVLREMDTIAALGGENAGPTVSRLGNDEFGILLGEVRGADVVPWIVERVINALGAPFEIDGQEVFATACLGVSLFPQDGETADVLIKNASAARRSAKTEAKPNGWQFYNDGINRRAFGQLQMEGQLRRALERGELELHYQPRVDLTSGRIAALEALLRWRRPVAGLIAPADFIPLAEETGLIHPIGEWVVRAACEQIAAWRETAFAGTRIAVNVSPLQLRRSDFGDRVLRVLGETGVNPRDLEVELTESAFIGNADVSIAGIRQLHAVGLTIAIDDFGTGYSSLSYLRMLPVGTVKIDRAFVQTLGDKDSGALVAGIVAMSRGMNLRVVAEGVERIEQLEILRKLGCDEVQGFLIARPAPLSELMALLEADRRQGLLGAPAVPWWFGRLGSLRTAGRRRA